MNDRLPIRDIVLLGAGHTNCHIIRMWRMHAIPDTRLTCVSNHLVATYSGMLAGTLAAQYEPARMEIDLVRSCAACGVRLVHAPATGLDPQRRRVLLADRPPLAYDLLSVGIGSRPTIPQDANGGISIKPMQTFQDRLLGRLQETSAYDEAEPLRLMIVGGGAAGIEIAFCLPKFLKRVLGNRKEIQLVVVEGGPEILAGMPPRTQKLARQELSRRNVALRLNSRAERVDAGRRAVLASGEEIAADLVIWATSASSPTPLAEFQLPQDDRGFLLTRDTLQSTGSDNVFVVGDAGTVQNTDLAKAGVYAVRQAPILWENLQRSVRGKELRHWQPQKRFLTLINTGDGRSILTYRGMSALGKWCWWLKDWIDSRFMDKYQRYEPRMSKGKTAMNAGEQEEQMQCGGCGCKASAGLLKQTLPRIQNPSADHVLWGLERPDDVALLEHPPGRAVMATTDFFTAFVDDPYLLGRIAALNALSDIYAKGGNPRAALSVAVLPPGVQSQQAQLLGELLDGACREFGTDGVPIVGGHSIVGPKLIFGFTILGDAEAERVVRASTPAAGDSLVLTKPLGTGALLAAHMQAACRSVWWESLVECMLASNRPAAEAALAVGVSASTDVTGFGLAGHLWEMLSPVGLGAEISPDALPLLDGTGEVFAQGFESTLAPANRHVAEKIEASSALWERPESAVLFDPQTSGGLLLSVRPEKVAELLSACGPPACVIGQVLDSCESGSAIHISR